MFNELVAGSTEFGGGSTNADQSSNKYTDRTWLEFAQFQPRFGQVRPNSPEIEGVWPDAAGIGRN